MNIFFSCVGGVGIGPLMEIANDAGYHVAGSDLVESLMTQQLQKKNIVINIGPQDGVFLQARHHDRPIDWFVYSSALTEDNAELVLAKKLGIHTAKRDELLAKIIKDKNLKLIAAAGTHGKTTTTGMLIWAFQKLNIPISYSVGTTLSFGPSGKFDPKSEYFVYECDEFDHNFLNFMPYLSLLSSIDYDHSETYPTTQDYLNAFKQFAMNSSQVISWYDQHSELFKDVPQANILDSQQIDNNLHIAGYYNRRNASLVKAAFKQLGIKQNIDAILTSFPGTSRRFEKLAEGLYTDYGHLPTEIAATLQLASELSKHVVLVYQPHQNIRQHELLSQYVNQFELAETIYWLPTYLTRENPELKVLTPADLIQNITNKQSVIIAELNDKLWNDVTELRNEGKLVLFMGAGTIDGWLRKKLSESL